MRHPASLSSRNPQLHRKYRDISGQRLPVSWLAGVSSSLFLFYGLNRVLPPPPSFSRTGLPSRADAVVISASSATALQFPSDTFMVKGTKSSREMFLWPRWPPRYLHHGEGSWGRDLPEAWQGEVTTLQLPVAIPYYLSVQTSPRWMAAPP